MKSHEHVISPLQSDQLVLLARQAEDIQRAANALTALLGLQIGGVMIAVPPAMLVAQALTIVRAIHEMSEPVQIPFALRKVREKRDGRRAQ